MKKFAFSFLVLIWICSNIQMAAQEKMLQVREDGVYMYVDQMPVYPKRAGGNNAIYSKNGKVSGLCKSKRSIRGTVLVQFVIKKNGKTSQFEVVRGVDPLLDEEALRVVKGIPGKWVPGREKGKKVPVSYTIPVSFRLSGENNSSSSNEGLKVNKNIKASLEGVWQICTHVEPLGYGKFDIQTGPYMKILSSDKNFFNIHLAITDERAVITAMGTYAQTSDCTYVEKIFKSITDPELTGADSKLKFEFISENLLQISYQLPGRPLPSKEIWVRVIQPNLKQPELFPQTL